MNNLNRDIFAENTILKECYLIQKKLSHKLDRLTFLAQNTNSQELVIIKILLFSHASFLWDHLKLFEREVKTLQNLDHPTIPKYKDYFEIDYDNIYAFALVQTYIKAPSLEKIVEEGRRFSEEELIEFTEKFLAILIYLHQQNPSVIHRDVKPSNILINNRSGNSIGDIYLVDFGSVQTAASTENGTITIVGSYGYIPLEQFGGQTTPASDLYSLGMTLIYLITGTHPAELSQVNGKVQYNSSHLSGKFTRWLNKLTEPYLDQRFDSATSALTALTSQESNSENFLGIKPAKNKIKLHRNFNKIEIVYETNSEKQGEEAGCLFFFIMWIVVTSFSGGILAIPWLFLSLFLWSIIRLVLPSKTLYSIISIKRNCAIKTGTFNSENPAKVQWNSYFYPARNSTLLVFNPGYTFNEYVDETGKKRKRGQVRVEPTLYLCGGNRECQIGSLSSKKLHKRELLWLGQELSDFLGLELQTIYPTPQTLKTK